VGSGFGGFGGHEEAGVQDSLIHTTITADWGWWPRNNAHHSPVCYDWFLIIMVGMGSVLSTRGRRRQAATRCGNPGGSCRRTVQASTHASLWRQTPNPGFPRLPARRTRARPPAPDRAKYEGAPAARGAAGGTRQPLLKPSEARPRAALEAAAASATSRAPRQQPMQRPDPHAAPKQCSRAPVSARLSPPAPPLARPGVVKARLKLTPGRPERHQFGPARPTGHRPAPVQAPAPPPCAGRRPKSCCKSREMRGPGCRPRGRRGQALQASLDTSVRGPCGRRCSQPRGAPVSSEAKHPLGFPPPPT
jgi:hypothetical protein